MAIHRFGSKASKRCQHRKGWNLELGEDRPISLSVGSCPEVFSFSCRCGSFVIASSGVPFDDDGLLRTRGALVHAKHSPLCLNTSTIRFKAMDGVSDLLLRLWLNTTEFVPKLPSGSLRTANFRVPPQRHENHAAAVVRAVADCGSAGSSGGVTGEAPCCSRPTQPPHSIDLPRSLWQSSTQS